MAVVSDVMGGEEHTRGLLARARLADLLAAVELVLSRSSRSEAIGEAER